MAFDKRKALQNALAYTQQGKWDRAIVEYQSILKADPRDLTVCNNLGDLYARAGKTAEAIDQYLQLGELYRTDGLSVKAIAVYKKIAKLDPARTEAYLACADLYWEQGLLGEAKIQMATVVEHYTRSGETPKLVDAYKRLVQYDPTNAAIIARLADVMQREGMREAAATEYERAAQAAQAAGQAAEAKRLLHKARELSPGAPKVNVALAEKLIGDNKIAEAVDALKAITSADSSNAKAWRLLGEVHAAQEQAADAIAAFQRAVALGVLESEVAGPLGLALLQTDRVDDALTLCQRVSASALAQGEPNAAIACCRDMLAAAPQCIALQAHLAAILQDLGRTDEIGVALRDLAAAQEAAGQMDGAAVTYHRLLEVDPSNAEARSRLEVLEPGAAAQPQVEEPVPSVTEEARVQSVEEIEGPPSAETTDVPLSSLADLGLSLGTDDAALLLEEPEPTDLTPPREINPPLSEDVAAPVEVQDTPSQTADWLTEELQSIDLEEAAAEIQAPIEWAPSGPPLELENVTENIGGPGIPVEPDVAPDASAGLLGEESPLIDVPVVELPSAPSESDASLLELPAPPPGTGTLDQPEEDTSSSQVAEQLAEADVYQKYGLEDKARERLMEVIRLEPDNLTARRRLKAICLDRRQTEEVCAEVLAIARVLRARGQEAAAAAEVREGLALTPDHAALLQFLVESPHGEDLPIAPAPLLAPEPARLIDSAAPPLAASAPLAIAEVPGAAGVGAPPPDVPLLLDLDDATHAPEAPTELEDAEHPTDGDALPTELQALLDESEAEPVIVIPEYEVGHDQAMADDVAEAEFYLLQGMTEEARTVLRRMQDRNAQDPAVAALAERIDGVSSAPAPVPPEAPLPAVTPEPQPGDDAPDAAPIPSVESSAPAPDAVPHFTVTDTPASEEQAGFVDLGAELDQELETDDSTPSAPGGGPLMDGLLKELQRGVREQLDEKDYETHYNLGIAYKEMELYDEAVLEFRLTAREPKRALECADLVGLCYLAKGQPEQAVQDLQAGLGIDGHPAEAYHNLRYDLGTAFEAIGDLPRALEQFEILQSEGARFLDVQTRVEGLRARLHPSPAPTTQPSEATRRKNKKKISFI